MTVCLETGRVPLGRKGRNRISSVRRVPVYRLHDNFLVQPGYVMAPLVPSRRKARKGRDQRWKTSEIVGASVGAFLVRGHDRHCAN